MPIDCFNDGGWALISERTEGFIFGKLLQSEELLVDCLRTSIKNRLALFKKDIYCKAMDASLAIAIHVSF